MDSAATVGPPKVLGRRRKRSKWVGSIAMGASRIEATQAIVTANGVHQSNCERNIDSFADLQLAKSEP